MKTINFSVKEILPSLLDKSKLQIIRPAWKEKLNNSLADPDIIIVNTKFKDIPYNEWNEKPPRFKVGEKVKIMWDQESKYDWFCKHCGEAKHLDKRISTDKKIGDVLKRVCLNYRATSKDYFNKTLGTVEITEVFKMEVSKEGNEFDAHTAVGGHDGFDSFYLIPGYKGYEKAIKDLAKKDGFSSAEQMFKVLDQMYDLSSPKEFYVYRWKWKK